MLSRRPRLNALIVCTCLAFAASGLHAGIVATDGNVSGLSVGNGGTEADPAIYVIGDTGPYHISTPNYYFNVGTASSYNHLIVRNGSSVTKEALSIGIVEGANHNYVHITGGSQLSLDTHLWVGRQGSYNTMRISGPGTTVSLGGYLTVGTASPSSHNTLIIEDGAFFESGHGTPTAYTVIGAGASSNNAVIVTGAGTHWAHRSSLDISVGNYQRNNTLTILDHALVSIDKGLYFMHDPGNGIFLDGGFLAIKGDVRDFIIDHTMALVGAFHYWDPNSKTWVVGGTNDFLHGYFADEADAFAFSGYEGLAGYTIITSLSTIPEPSTYAALAGAAVLGLVAFRRYRRH